MEAWNCIGTCTGTVLLTALLGGGGAAANDREGGQVGAGADTAPLHAAAATAAAKVNAKQLRARLRAAIEADEPEKHAACWSSVPGRTVRFHWSSGA